MGREHAGRLPVTVNEVGDVQYTRRQYLIMRSVNRGATYTVAANAVQDAIDNNPEWDTEEVKTYIEWGKERV